jgi:hypothetical protein
MKTHFNYLSIFFVSVSVAVFWAGCSDDFTPYSRLDRLRVMAIQSEPATPVRDVPVQLSPLVYVPAGKTASYSWSWCPLPSQSEDGYRCPVSEQALAPLLASLGLDEPISLGLGTEPTTVFVNPFDPALLARVCAQGIKAGEASLDIWCTIDFPVLVTLKIKTSTESLTSVVTLHLPIEDGAPGNANPVIEGIRIVKPAPTRQLDDLGTITVRRDEEVTFEAIVPDEASETFVDKNEDGNSVTRRERLTVSWFSDAGDWDADRAAYIEGKYDLKRATRNKWKAPKTEDFKEDKVSIFVVVRDDRGGTSWVNGVVTLGDAK